MKQGSIYLSTPRPTGRGNMCSNVNTIKIEQKQKISVKWMCTIVLSVWKQAEYTPPLFGVKKIISS